MRVCLVLLGALCAVSLAQTSQTTRATVSWPFPTKCTEDICPEGEHCVLVRGPPYCHTCTVPLCFPDTTENPTGTTLAPTPPTQSAQIRCGKEFCKEDEKCVQGPQGPCIYIDGEKYCPERPYVCVPKVSVDVDPSQPPSPPAPGAAGRTTRGAAVTWFRSTWWPPRKTSGSNLEFSRGSPRTGTPRPRTTRATRPTLARSTRVPVSFTRQ